MRELDPEQRLRVTCHHGVPDEDREPRNESACRRQTTRSTPHPQDAHEAKRECGGGPRADQQIRRPNETRVPQLRVEKPRDVPGQENPEPGANQKTLGLVEATAVEIG